MTRGPMAPLAPLVDEWRAQRREVRELERAEHPDIVDVLGRVWTWIDGDLYGHDGMAWPEEFVRRPSMRLPTRAALDNPNYRWCRTCKPPIETVTTTEVL